MSGKRAAKRHDGWTKPRRNIFLKTLAERANISAAARAAGMSTTGAYKLRRSDPEFAQNWETALESAMDELEAVAYERAMFGVERQVVRSGGPVTIRDYPDNLLMFLLKRRRPASIAALADASHRLQREREICDGIEERLVAVEARRDEPAQ